MYQISQETMRVYGDPTMTEAETEKWVREMRALTPQTEEATPAWGNIPSHPMRRQR